MRIMRLASLVYLLFLQVIITSVFAGSQGNASFRFLTQIPSFRTHAFSSNLTIDCSTNDANVTTKLYVRYQTGSPWKQLVAKSGKVLQKGHEYTIVNFGLLDIGEYQCNAVNRVGHVITSSGMVYGYKQVKYVPKIRVNPQKPQTVNLGSSVEFACISEPFVKIKWFKVVNNRYRSVSRYRVSRRRNGKELRLVLKFIEVSSQDEGRYMCRMKYQDKIQDEKYVELKISKLKFLQKPKAFTTHWLSSNFTINCTTNNPDAKAAVYYRKYAVQPNNDWKLLTLIPGKFAQEGQVFTMIGIGVQDMGQYQCRAWSKEGALIRWPNSHGVLVTVPKINLDMSITSKLTGPVRSSSNHTITCSTTLLSARLQWYKMMRSAKTYIAVPQDKLVKVKNDKQNKLVLQLSRVTLSDAGVYKCVMKYHGKKKTLLTALNVGFKPKARSRKAIVVLAVGSRLVLPCTATGLPSPTVTWTKDGTSIGCRYDDNSCQLDGHYVIRNKSKKDQSVRSVLRIKKVQVGDQGIYRCVAMNKYGVDRSETRVVIIA